MNTKDKLQRKKNQNSVKGNKNVYLWTPMCKVVELAGSWNTQGSYPLSSQVQP